MAAGKLASRAVAAVALLLAAAAARPEVVWRPGFGREALWNDGNAEVSVYDARDVREGLARDSRATLIVVAEDLNRDKLVKADRPQGGAGTLRVLKLNHVRSIRAGVSVYSQMLSAFLAADRLDAVKLTMTSHDWCGNSFVEWRSDRRLLSIRSYFETAADTDVPFDPGAGIFYDTLALVLRGLDFDRTRTGRLSVLESVFGSAPVVPTAQDALLTVAPASPSLWRVTLLRGARRDVFDFETAFPHRLVRWEGPDGGRLTLIASRRFPYWQKNHPGDETLLPGAVAR